MTTDWLDACATDDIEPEDVIARTIGGRALALYRTEDGRYYATDGLCTHERVSLAEGLLMDNIIECPKHNGRFDITTGAAKGAPVCVDLKTYPVRLENGRVLVQVA